MITGINMVAIAQTWLFRFIKYCGEVTTEWTLYFNWYY